ncbi:RNA polymerase sigma factor [Dyadobacter subterraneus]|uniref:RNA polymerase sigma factor n=1 Tax=Dyadobacter subterraneus TaxID=2773304 RepID=A0ABR9WHS4_9BACT|nr:RNA polymerase sigma factor [Dyadobacter subterraneus]MBE9463714.1 RNA polymerase sigma factor [Dyadobacter subterraneus]
MNEDWQRKHFQEIMEQHRGIVFKVVRVYCHNEFDRQDLFQEIMIQVWQSLHRYDNQYKISTWLYRIALNVAISFYRRNAVRRAKHIQLNEEAAQIVVPGNTSQEQQLSQLEEFISELQEIDKALMLLYLEEKSHAEIAEIVGVSVSNVGTKISRIKDKLKHRLTEKMQSL